MQYLRFVSHPDVEDVLIWLRNPQNERMELFNHHPYLLPGEVIALNYYTHRGDQINNYFRSGLDSIHSQYMFSHNHVAVYRQFLDGALDKLPPHEISSGYNLWRGVGMHEGNLLKNLLIGEIYSPPFYYSTSVELEIAFNAMRAKGGDVVVAVESGPIKGANISDFSRYREFEVLYKMGVKFEKTAEILPIPGYTEYIEIALKSKQND